MAASLSSKPPQQRFSTTLYGDNDVGEVGGDGGGSSTGGGDGGYSIDGGGPQNGGRPSKGQSALHPRSNGVGRCIGVIVGDDGPGRVETGEAFAGPSSTLHHRGSLRP